MRTTLIGLLLSSPLLAQQAPQPKELCDFDLEWNYAKPKETEQGFRKMLEQRKLRVGPEYTLSLRTQIARAQGMQRKFAEAHATLDAVFAELEKGRTVPVARTRYLLERGRTFNSSGEVPKGETRTPKQLAAELFLAAYHVARSHGFDYHAIDAAHMLAIVLPPEKALRWHEVCRRMVNETDVQAAKSWSGPVLNNLAWTYHDMKEYEKALAVFREALAYRNTRKPLGPKLIARWSVARCLRSLGRLAEALEIQKELEAEREKLKRPDGYVFEELGELHLAMGNEAKAKPYFAKAFELLSKDAWLRKNEPKRLERIGKLGGKD